MVDIVFVLCFALFKILLKKVLDIGVEVWYEASTICFIHTIIPFRFILHITAHKKSPVSDVFTPNTGLTFLFTDFKAHCHCDVFPLVFTKISAVSLAIGFCHLIGYR